MRGQQNIVAVSLLALLALGVATTYYLFASGYFSRLTASQSDELKRAMELAAANLRVSEAKIYQIPDTNLAVVAVYLFTSGDEAVPLYGDIVWELLENGVHVAGYPPAMSIQHVGSASSVSSFDPGELYLLQTAPFELNQGIYNKEILLYINRAAFSAILEPAEYPGTFSGYITCSGCADCTTKISGAAPQSLVYVTGASATGDCIQIVGKSDITISCTGTISGNGTGTGILIQDSDNVTIWGCDVSNFAYGIQVVRSTDTSFQSAKSHDNSIFDVVLDLNDDSKYCAQGTVDLTTTSGRLQYFSGDSGPYTPTDASAVWVWASNNLQVSGGGDTLSGVTPAILVCSSTDTHISNYTISQTTVGARLMGDTSTLLESLTIQGSVYGVRSTNSNGSRLLSVTVISPTDEFVDPTSFDWSDSTFR